MFGNFLFVVVLYIAHNTKTSPEILTFECLSSQVLMYISSINKILFKSLHDVIYLNRAEMTKYYVEAKDNVRFLSTLERHFKNLSQGNSFQIVLDTIPSLMTALHMVWIISRHYNKDERMVPLMERIAWEVAERVARVINVRRILRLVMKDVHANNYSLISSWTWLHQPPKSGRVR